MQNRSFILYQEAKWAAKKILCDLCQQQIDGVAQEALIKLVRIAIKRCRNEGMIVPLLRKIARQKALDVRRSAWGKGLCLR